MAAWAEATAAVLARSGEGEAAVTRVELKPVTGRTHQLRVAMKSLGSPILGDELYHPHVPDWPDRMYLHAHTLRFGLKKRGNGHTQRLG